MSDRLSRRGLLTKVRYELLLEATLVMHCALCPDYLSATLKIHQAARGEDKHPKFGTHESHSSNKGSLKEYCAAVLLLQNWPVRWAPEIGLRLLLLLSAETRPW